MSPRRLVGACLGLVVSMAACNAVPDLFFVDGKDAGNPNLLDAGPRDADSSDADFPDTDEIDLGEAGSKPSTCPASLPPNATTCCGTTACHGFKNTVCNADECAECSRCAPNTLCCIKNNGMLGGCLPLDDTCPR